MRKIYSILIFLFLFVLKSYSNNIVQYEYWYDGNYANRITNDITPTENFVWLDSLNIQSFGMGLHVFQYRFKDDLGLWSNVNQRFFIPNSSLSDNKITTYEYWYDGNYTSRITTDITPTENFVWLDSLNIQSFGRGLHVFQFRFKDELGLWSNVNQRFFIPNSLLSDNKITTYEYWYDGNYASRITTDITPIESFVWIDSLNIQSFGMGLHVFQFRFKDEMGQWSNVNQRFFLPGTIITDNKITGYDYWFDDNYANKVSATVIPTASLILLDSLDISQFNQGLHIFSFRINDEIGQWSGVKISFFVVTDKRLSLPDNKVSAYRYWLDDNVEAMVSVTLDTQVSPYTLINDIQLPVYDHGSSHFFKVQFMDIAGQWGSVMIDSLVYISRAKQLYPVDSSSCVELAPVFKWQKFADQAIYHIQLSDSPQFTNLLINSDNITDTTFQPVANLAASRLYYWRLQEHYGDYTSNWSDTWIFSTIASGATYSISGDIKYNNNALTPIGNVSVLLKDNQGNQVSVTKADELGHFSFDCQSNGSYVIWVVTLPDKPWGGLNTSDIVQTKKKIAFLIAFTPLQNKAADVNMSNSVNTGDVSIMRQKIAFLNPLQWIIPNYVFESPNLTVNGSNVDVQIKALCGGDVNGSYIPPQ